MSSSHVKALGMKKSFLARQMLRMRGLDRAKPKTGLVGAWATELFIIVYQESPSPPLHQTSNLLSALRSQLIPQTLSTQHNGKGTCLLGLLGYVFNLKLILRTPIALFLNLY